VLRSRIAILTAALCLVVTVSCSSDDNGGSATKDTKGQTSTEKPPPAPAGQFNQAFEEGTPKDGGSIKIGVEAEIASLDPAGALADVSDYDIALAIYDPLVDYDTKGNLAPGLATQWSGSTDFKTWTLQLRKGVQFNDGTPFNADAVVKQFQRLKDPATKCVCAANVAHITQVEAQGASTVVFTLNEANAFFISSLNAAIGLIASPTATAKYGADYARHPVGTGAFALTSYDPIVLKKNPHYWRKDAKGRTLPHLDKITVQPITENTIRLQSLAAGDIDLMQVGDTNTIIKAIQAGKYTVQKITGGSSTSVSMNNRKPPFNDVRVRQAFAQAVNRDEINNIEYQGSRQLAYSQFATTSPWYDADAGWLTYNQKKAKERVAAAKADGVPTKFTLTCVTSDESRQLLNIVKQQIAKVGLTADLEFVDQGTYVHKLLDADHSFVAGCSRNGENLTPDLYDGWHTKGSFNAEGYHNPESDKIMEDIRATSDPKEQKKLVDQLQAHLANDVPAFPLLYDLHANIANKDVSGLPVPKPVTLGVITFADLYLVA
jgi:peptide/nickel transport system substrate-binding protein